MAELVEIAPGRWRFVRPSTPPARSDLPTPHIISDTMPATEQVDGQFYESKSAFRRVGRQYGLTEVGNEKVVRTLVRPSQQPQVKKARRETVQKVIAEHKAGRRPVR